MKNFALPLLAYMLTSVITILIPASDGYNTIGWKLFVGQIYAIPVLIIATFITIYLNKKRLHIEE